MTAEGRERVLRLRADHGGEVYVECRTCRWLSEDVSEVPLAEVLATGERHECATASEQAP